MKLLILTAIIAAVASNPLTEDQKWPWQVGKEYLYNVDTYTWTKFEQSNSNGNAIKSQFIVRVMARGHLIAKLKNPLYAQVQGHQSKDVLPSGLEYQPVQNIDHPFEIFIDGGRIISLKIPTTLSVAHENLLKGLVSALQVDLSPYRYVDSFPNSYHKNDFQGLFKKMEVDVTGDCETLYSVSPVSAEWRHELPDFAKDPVEITKSRNYGSCAKSVGYNFGVPEGAVWKGVAYNNEEKQFIKHTSVSRMLVGNQGTIYKSETTSSVFVNPLLFGSQKAEVHSYVGITLASVQSEKSAEWHISIKYRKIDSLLFTMKEEAFIMAGEQNVAHALKLLQDITPLLQNPNELPESDFLSKFNVLVHLIMSMNSQQLTQMTSSIVPGNSSETSIWKIYRDAVAQAGTIAAFKEIKSWILAKKIAGTDAAEVISSIASNLRHPTKEIINELFEMTYEPIVLNKIEQDFVKSSILLAATKLMRYCEDDFFRDDIVIPRLSRELKQAIREGHSSDAQVYIKALGNIAHPSILKAFGPYFDGRIAVNKYLRTQMVISLKTLANTRNDYVSAVLFSLLRNTAEPYEVRVAAAQNIFMSYPTFGMMQIMAYMANRDPSTQVRAVLKNGIRSVAELKDPRFVLLAKTAKAALDILSKDKYGYGYSADSMIDQYTDDEQLAHFTEFSSIGSANNILPVYQRGALRFRSTSGSEEEWFSLFISDIQKVMAYLLGRHVDPNTDANFKFSAKDIVEILNIKRQPSDPLEGSLVLEDWNQQQFFTFDEQFFIKMRQDIFHNELHNKPQFDNAKITQKQVFITFPIASGMPFVFRYSEPTADILRSQSSLANDTMESMIYEYQYTYSRNLDGRVGFLDTLGDMYATVGIINKLQYFIPIKISNIVTMSGQYQWNFVFPDQNTNLIHMSVWPYTALQKTNSLITVSKDLNTKIIERPVEVLSTDFKFGHSTGTVFQFQGKSFSSDYKDPSSLFNTDLFTSVRNLLYQKDVALTQFNLMYLANETKNNYVTYTAFYDKRYNNKENEEMGSATPMDDVTPKARDRRASIVNRVASGIESASVQLVDFSAVFQGKQKVEYVFTAAMADSYVDNKFQAALFFHGQEQFNAIFKVVKPKIVPLNFEEALKNKIKVIYEADLKYGNSEIVHLKGFGERSEEYTERLRNDPLAKQCLQEISKHNLYQKDCSKMIIKAHSPDYFNTTIIYKELNPALINLTYNIYGIYKHLYSWKEDVDVFKTTEDGKIEIEAQAFYYGKIINYVLKTKYGMLSLKNVKGIFSDPYAMAIYAPISNWERYLNWFTGYENLPFCTVDDNKIWTFSGRSYDYSLSSSWHVVMVDKFNDSDSWQPELVILARRPSINQMEVYVSYRTVAGSTLEINITPIIVVKSNTKKVGEGALKFFDDNTQTPLLEYYNIAKGVTVFNINNGALRLVYDNQRVVIFTGDHRSTTTGICGQSTTEVRDDYMTPNGLVDSPEHYGASFSLEGEFSDPKTVDLKKEAKLKAYRPVTKYTNINRSDAEREKQVDF